MAEPATPAPPSPPASPLVGREREQASLRAALAAALAGRGSLVLIGGEAGIGKTALAEWLLAEATQQGALVLVGRCYDLSETPPYGPWVEALARSPRDDDMPAPPDLAGGQGVASQAAFYDHVLAFFRAVAARCPLALLLDDLQWADQASLDLLRVVARGLADRPVLLLAAHRTDEVTRRHPLYALIPLLLREAAATPLELRPLGEDDTRALVGARYPLSAADAGRLTAYLAARSEGNALFVAQLLRALEEQGILRRDGPGWTLGDIGDPGLPVPLRRVIETRLARLDEATRALLEVAAVLGQAVPLDLWASAAGVGAAAVEGATAAAGATGLLEASADGAGARFVHALVREAVYAGIFPPRRRALHRVAGEVLATTPATDPDATAYHFAQGGDPRAVAWLLRAADRAERVFALRTAAARLDAALALAGADRAAAGERGWLLLRLAQLHRYGDHHRGLAALDDAERAARSSGDGALAALALFQRGYLRCQHGPSRQGVDELAAGVAALDALSPAEWAHGRARARTVDPPDAATGRGTLALFLAVTGRYAEAGALLAPLVARAPASGAVRAADAPAYQAWAIVQGAVGQAAAARQAYAAARVAYEATGNALLVASMGMQELRHVVLPYQADALAEREGLARQAADALGRAGGISPLGDFPPAVAALPLLVLAGRWAEARELVALRDRAGAWRGPWRGLLAGAAAALARAQGASDLARAIVREALPAGPATEPGDDDCREALPLQCLAALLHLDAGDLATARAWLGAHDRWLAWSGTVLGRAEGQLAWAQHQRLASDPALARQHAERGLAHAGDPRQPLALLAAHRLLGELDTTAGRPAEAAAHLAAALALAEACAAPYERALTLLALAELRAATGQHDEARAALSGSRATFADLRAAPALARADALAATLAAPVLLPSHPDGLTAREVEVLRLYAADLPYRAIAARLAIAPRTVGTHVTSIFGKTGIASRLAAARYAAKHGLA